MMHTLIGLCTAKPRHAPSARASIVRKCFAFPAAEDRHARFARVPLARRKPD